MSSLCKIGILSDVHYAGAAEQARGGQVRNPLHS